MVAHCLQHSSVPVVIKSFACKHVYYTQVRPFYLPRQGGTEDSSYRHEENMLLYKNQTDPLRKSTVSQDYFNDLTGICVILHKSTAGYH